MEAFMESESQRISVLEHQISRLNGLRESIDIACDGIDTLTDTLDSKLAGTLYNLTDRMEQLETKVNELLKQERKHDR
jgi:chaperonin cofactor prefoldin